jgi:hypothetical protein
MTKEKNYKQDKEPKKIIKKYLNKKVLILEKDGCGGWSPKDEGFVIEETKSATTSRKCPQRKRATTLTHRPTMNKRLGKAT